jgi:hypothetical protein
MILTRPYAFAPAFKTSGSRASIPDDFGRRFNCDSVAFLRSARISYCQHLSTHHLLLWSLLQPPAQPVHSVNGQSTTMKARAETELTAVEDQSDRSLMILQNSILHFGREF